MTFMRSTARSWPTWARISLLALIVAVVGVLILPGIVRSEHGGVDPIVTVVPHVGGGAVADCTFAEDFEGGAFSSDAYAFTSNPGRDEGDDIEVFDSLGTVDDWTVRVQNVSRTEFDWELRYLGETVEHDEGLRAPGNNRSVSHVSFCLTAQADDSLSVIAVEVKGSKNTNHHFYAFACGTTEAFSEEYTATFNCISKGSVSAVFQQSDTNNDNEIDTVELHTFGSGSAIYIEYIDFDPQAAAHAGASPFTLMYDDIAPFGDVPLAVPQCVFNPDVDGNGIVDDLDGDGEGNGDAGDPTDVQDNSLAAGAVPGPDTTCYFLAQFTQDGDGLWSSSYGLANIGDGWRTIY